MPIFKHLLFVLVKKTKVFQLTHQEKEPEEEEFF
jgi:hypothetical protein